MNKQRSSRDTVLKYWRPLPFTKKSPYLYRPKSWLAVTMWNAWGFPGMLQALSSSLEMVPCSSRGVTGAGMGHCRVCAWLWHWHLCRNILLHKTRTVISHVVPKGAVRLTVAIDKWVTENLAQHWKLLLSVPSPPRVTLISETSMWAKTTQLLLWKSRRHKLSATVESCGKLLHKPLQQESQRIACQPPK